MKVTELKAEAIFELVERAQSSIERAMLMRELMDDMGAPADIEILARKALECLSEVFDRLEDIKGHLTISGL